MMARDGAVLFIRRWALGLLLGVAMVIPGFSGGVLAVSMGLYEPLLDAVGHFFRAPKQNFYFLLPLALGGAVSVVAGAALLRQAFVTFHDPLVCLFVGLVAGTVPGFVREANARGFRWGYLAWAALGAALAVLGGASGFTPPAAGSELTWAGSLLAGAILAVGTVVPGVSASFLLMVLGLYLGVTRTISTLDLPRLIPLALSFTAVSLAAVQVAGWLFRRFHGPACYAVLGLMTGLTALLLAPLARWEWVSLVNLLILAAGVVLGRLLEKAMGQGEPVTPAAQGTIRPPRHTVG